MELITPENLQIAGLAVVAVSLVVSGVSLIKFILGKHFEKDTLFADAIYKLDSTMVGLDKTMSNHYNDLHGLISDFREELRSNKK